MNHLTITAYNGFPSKLSDDVYRIKDSNEMTHHNYPIGMLVRLIGGLNENDNTPGNHFKEGWVTVCRELADKAEFVGFEKDQLELVGTFPRRLQPIDFATIIASNEEATDSKLFERCMELIKIEMQSNDYMDKVYTKPHHEGCYGMTVPFMSTNEKKGLQRFAQKLGS